MSDEENRNVAFHNTFSSSNPNVPLGLHGDNRQQNPTKKSTFGYTTNPNVPDNDYRRNILVDSFVDPNEARKEFKREVINGTITNNYGDANLKWKTVGSNQILALINKDGTFTPLDEETITNTSKNERQTIFKTFSEFFAKMYGYEGGKKSKSRKLKSSKKRKTIRRRK